MHTFPSHEDLVGDLLSLRQRGLAQLRNTRLEALHQAAALCGYITGNHGTGPPAPSPTTVEALLREAIGRLGDGTLGEAAGYTLGTTPGTRGQPGRYRREKAAEVYDLSVERFRKSQERIVLNQIAEMILSICHEQGTQTSFPPEEDADASPARFTVPIGNLPTHVVVHVSSIDLLTGIDIVVSSENVYLEMAKTFKSSVSAALRRAGARKNAAGEIVTDLIQDELNSWTALNARMGLPVAPGTVVPTSPGELTGNGVRRIYHAAIAIPRPRTNDYEVEPAVIARAVHNVFRKAEEERHTFDPPLASVCFPLLGSGRGGLDVETSFGWMWGALRDELSLRSGWTVHIVTRRQHYADLVRRMLTATDPADGTPESADP